MVNKSRFFLVFGVLLATIVFYALTIPRPIISIPSDHFFSGEKPITLEKLDINQIFSFSFWVKPGESNVAWADILDYRHKHDKSFAFHQNADSANLYVFGVHSKNGAQGVYAELNPHVWQHVVLVKTHNSLSIYVNGNLIDHKVDKEEIIVDYLGDEILTIGGWGYGGRFWVGEISCFKVFDTSLTIDIVHILGSKISCRPHSEL